MHTSRGGAGKKLTEGEEGEDSDDSGEGLHVERIEVGVVDSKVAANRREMELVGDTIL